MDELMKILQELEPDVNYREEQALIDAHILDSFLILELVAELEDTYHIRISPADIVAENFNSAGAMWQMIERLKEDRYYGVSYNIISGSFFPGLYDRISAYAGEIPLLCAAADWILLLLLYQRHTNHLYYSGNHNYIFIRSSD